MWAAALPFALAAVTAHALFRLKEPTGGPRPAASAVAVLLPMVIGACAFGVPEEKWGRFVFLIAGSSALAMLAVSINRWWAYIVATLLTAAVASGAWMWWDFYHDESLWVQLIPAAALVAFMIGLEPLGRRIEGATLPAALAISACALSVVSVLSGNGFIAIFAVSPASALAASIIAAALSRDFTLARGALIPIAMILTSVPHLSWMYSYDVPRAFVAAFALTAGAPLALWLVLPFTNRLSAPKRFAWGITLVVVVAGIGVAIALNNSDTSAYGS